MSRAPGTKRIPGPSSPVTPDPLHEEPPADRYCDVVLNGGVASGVVYPWALLELAREYRFKNIGGNSVGAMAAAIAAAAEYGRCNGVENAFEALRRMPTDLAELKGGKTKMLRLFQPSPPLSRLFELFVASVREDPAPEEVGLARKAPTGTDLLRMAFGLYGLWWPLAFFLGLGTLATWAARNAGVWGLFVAVVFCFMVAGALAITAVIGSVAFWNDLRRLGRNGYGLCTGRSQAPTEEGLVEWLHRGIQLAAGRIREDPPLTFADLWATPRAGQPGSAPLPGGLKPNEVGIDLQMFASNVTHGRPVRLPLADPVTRLFYRRDEWDAFFPSYVMDALDHASNPYAPASDSDPDPSDPNAPLSSGQMALVRSLRELPSGGMPIVVAARLSLCFPLLFSCVPVYAIDYEQPDGHRSLRKCLLSDGGLCTNFPIHLFDAAHPRWPTFGFLLDQRLQDREGEAVWLPETHLEGRGDNWQRDVPGAEDDDQAPRSLRERLLGLLTGMILTTKDWNDRVTGRLPQVRNRVIRLALQKGEGQLNLGMPPQTILRMADQYGTGSGKKLLEAFAPDRNGVKRAWREHLYIRSMVETRALNRHLRDYSLAVHARGATVPLPDILSGATTSRPLMVRKGRSDPSGAEIDGSERDTVGQAVRAIEALEGELSAAEGGFGPYRPVPEPELHMRPPI